MRVPWARLMACCLTLWACGAAANGGDAAMGNMGGHGGHGDMNMTTTETATAVGGGHAAHAMLVQPRMSTVSGAVPARLLEGVAHHVDILCVPAGAAEGYKYGRLLSQVFARTTQRFHIHPGLAEVTPATLAEVFGGAPRKLAVLAQGSRAVSRTAPLWHAPGVDIVGWIVEDDPHRAWNATSNGLRDMLAAVPAAAAGGPAVVAFVALSGTHDDGIVRILRAAHIRNWEHAAVANTRGRARKIADFMIERQRLAAHGATPPAPADMQRVVFENATTAGGSGVEQINADIADGETTMRNVVVRPTGGPPAHAQSGVLVVPSWAGVSQREIDVATTLAAQFGTHAIVVDVFGDGATPVTTTDRIANVTAARRNNWAQAHRRLSLAHHALVRDFGVDPAWVSAVGYCFGGAAVLMHTFKGSHLRAAVAVHGTMHGIVDDNTVLVPDAQLMKVYTTIVQLTNDRDAAAVATLNHKLRRMNVEAYYHVHEAAHPTDGCGYEGYAALRSMLSVVHAVVRAPPMGRALNYLVWAPSARHVPSTTAAVQHLSLPPGACVVVAASAADAAAGLCAGDFVCVDLTRVVGGGTPDALFASPSATTSFCSQHSHGLHGRRMIAAVVAEEALAGLHNVRRALGLRAVRQGTDVEGGGMPFSSPAVPFETFTFGVNDAAGPREESPLMWSASLMGAVVRERAVVSRVRSFLGEVRAWHAAGHIEDQTALLPSVYPVTHRETKLDVDIPDGNVSLMCMLHVPVAARRGEGARGAVFVVPPERGLGMAEHRVASILAMHGITALAVDVHGDGLTSHTDATDQANDHNTTYVRMRLEENSYAMATRRIQLAYDYLLANVTRGDASVIGGIGFGFGGAALLRFALEVQPLDFAAAVYAGVDGAAGGVSNATSRTATVYQLLGELDEENAADARTLHARMARRVPHHYQALYSDAQHCFADVEARNDGCMYNDEATLAAVSTALTATEDWVVDAAGHTQLGIAIALAAVLAAL